MQNQFQVDHTLFEFISTEDQSPSICMSSPKFRPEAMHHRKGALSESLYIYYESLRHAVWDIRVAPHLLSIGIGCAYNELLMGAFLSQFPTFIKDAYLESFEGDPILRTEFTNWLNGQAPESEVGTKLHETYSLVEILIIEHFQLKSKAPKQVLHELFQNKKFVVRGWLDSKTSFTKTFGVIFYDAFSSQSTPEIWQETFLNSFLKMVAADTCLFATYASTGALKRSLRAANFNLLDQIGFAGKRQSTRAIRSTNSGQSHLAMLGSPND